MAGSTSYYPGNQDPHKSLQPIRSGNSRSRLPRNQRSTTESTEIHGKENPNQLPLSVSFRSTSAVCSRIAYSDQKRPWCSYLLPAGEGAPQGRMRAELLALARKSPHPAVPARPRKRGSPRSPREKERRPCRACNSTVRRASVVFCSDATGTPTPRALLAQVPEPCGCASAAPSPSAPIGRRINHADWFEAMTLGLAESAAHAAVKGFDGGVE